MTPDDPDRGSNGGASERPVRIATRPLGLPWPLGYAGLTVATVVLACLHLGWLPEGDRDEAALAFVAFAAPLQALTAVFALLGRDTPVATAMGTLSGAWLVIGLFTLTSAPGETSPAVGVVLLAAALALLSPLASTIQIRRGPALLLALAATHFTLIGLYEVTSAAVPKVAGAVVGLCLGGGAAYLSLALQLEEAFGRTVLPIGRRGEAAVAVQGDLSEEVAGVERAPGVRRRL